MRIDPNAVPQITPKTVADWARDDPKTVRDLIYSPELWRAIVRGSQALVSEQGSAADASGDLLRSISAGSRAGVRRQLARDGYCRLPTSLRLGIRARLADTIVALCRQGWPAPFVCVADEAWWVAAAVDQQVRWLLSPDLQFRGELSAFCVDPSLPGGWPQGVPPHRDRQGSGAAGAVPRHLTCWVALTDAVTDNGCVHVVPKSLEREDRFDDKALEVPAGSVLAWDGEVIHWGGRYNCERAVGARVALALSLTHRELCAGSDSEQTRWPLAKRLERIDVVLRQLHPPAQGSDLEAVARLLRSRKVPAMVQGHRVVGAALDRAIERGVANLERRRAGADDGLWHDFARQAGGQGSNVWVSAFVAAQLGEVEEGRSVAQEVATRLLAQRRASGGWGYDEHLLEDCDSTAWVLLAAGRSGVTVAKDQLISALRFILGHQTSDGGFVTYASSGRMNFGDSDARRGWFEPQVCVSAAAVAALGMFADPRLPATGSAVDYLRRQRGTDGLWHAYWWYGFGYGTYHAFDALARLDADPPVAEVGQAVVAAVRDDGGWGCGGLSDAFSTALALTTLCALESAESAPGSVRQAIERGVQRLLAFQDEGGGFAPGANLRVPGGEADETWRMLDNGTFTTACAVHALAAVRADVRGSELEVRS